jgi:hypothetical protein
MREYVLRAARNELVVFLEGFPSDTNRLRHYLQETYGVSGGLVFGCEHEIANAICGILIHLGYCRASDMREQARVGNFQTCYDIVMIDEVRSAWNEIQQYRQDNPLIASVNEIIQGYNITNVRQMANDIYTQHRRILEDPGWIDIYRRLYDNLIERVPPTLRGPLNDPRVREYINSEQNVEQDYVVHRINLEWRNDLIVRNISDTIRSNELDVDEIEIFIFIGSAHIRGMIIPLMKRFGRVNIVEDANRLPLL